MKLKSKIKRRVNALKTVFKNKIFLKNMIKKIIDEGYRLSEQKKRKVQTVGKKFFIDKVSCIHIPNIELKDGNLAFYELIFLSMLVNKISPLSLLEIGTFNGCSTLIMALNTKDHSQIDTLDLNIASQYSHKNDEDIKYIECKEKMNKYYENYQERKKIHEHLGDSMDFDFTLFGLKDFIFIDGAHSYDHVKNDTEKGLSILKDGGICLWHDYDPLCEGVFKYLNELSQDIPLYHVENTSFVIYKKASFFQ